MKNALRKIVIASLLAIVATFIFAYNAIYIPATEYKSNSYITFVIKSGASVSQIGGKLERSGLISKDKWFRVYTMVSGKDKLIRSGTYKIPVGLNMVEIVEFLTANNEEVYYNPNKIAFPEGLTQEQIIDKMVKADIGTKKELLAIFTDKSFIKEQVGVNASALEGFLYPKTYYFEDDISAKDFLIKYPIKEFKREFSTKYDIGSQEFYKNLILASIVQKESGSDKEKPIVASVFLNRLQKKMNLASCATHNKIFYQNGDKPPKVLRNRHLEIDSPFNTYKYIGLPPTPICSPSVATYNYVVNPAKTKYLFFFADFKGNNVFSKTYKEHNQKKKELWKSSKA
ncbi:MAG: hypothetical protein B6226_04825 [Candidatus Cloacimonetes bacterium 4572_65]|nr:MAG: hypothetical protein B6226_04825 [Candidatus Cloacimonetes bacterium 4572_65]